MQFSAIATPFGRETTRHGSLKNNIFEHHVYIIFYNIQKYFLVPLYYVKNIIF